MSHRFRCSFSELTGIKHGNTQNRRTEKRLKKTKYRKKYSTHIFVFFFLFFPGHTKHTCTQPSIYLKMYVYPKRANQKRRKKMFTLYYGQLSVRSVHAICPCVNPFACTEQRERNEQRQQRKIVVQLTEK